MATTGAGTPRSRSAGRCARPAPGRRRARSRARGTTRRWNRSWGPSRRGACTPARSRRGIRRRWRSSTASGAPATGCGSTPRPATSAPRSSRRGMRRRPLRRRRGRQRNRGKFRFNTGDGHAPGRLRLTCTPPATRVAFPTRAAPPHGPHDASQPEVVCACAACAHCPAADKIRRRDACGFGHGLNNATVAGSSVGIRSRTLRSRPSYQRRYFLFSLSFLSSSRQLSRHGHPYLLFHGASVIP